MKKLQLLTNICFISELIQDRTIV